MAQITIDIPNGVLSRVLDAFTVRYNYNPLTDGTKAQFAKQTVINFIKRTVHDAEVGSAVSTAVSNTEADINTNIILG